MSKQLLLAVCGLVTLAPAAACGGSNASPDPAEGIWLELEPQSPPVGTMLGVSTHMRQDDATDLRRDFEFEVYADLGGLRIREDYHWHKLEPADDQWNMDAVRYQVEQARQLGIEIDAMLAYGVDWAMEEGQTSTIDPAEYGEFAGQVALEYCADIELYEIWNEPNLSRFWEPDPDPEHYGLLLKAAYEAIHNACPDARVLFGGLASYDFQDLADQWSFLRKVGEAHADICAFFDVLAIHPYTLLQFSSPENDYLVGQMDFRNQTRMTARARDILADMGCPERPVHFTEMGWPSLDIGEESQARYLARSVLLAARDGVEAYYWYTFWDGDPDTENSVRPQEDTFGLFGYPGAGGDVRRAKPAYDALAGLVAVLGTARFARDAGPALELPEDVHLLLFVDDDDDAVVVAAWDGRDDPDRVETDAAPGGPDTFYELELPLPEGATEVTRYDLNGEQLETHDPSALLSLTLTPAVQYVVVR